MSALFLLAPLISLGWAAPSAYVPAIRAVLAARAGPGAPAAINALERFRADASPDFIERVLAPIASRLESAGVSPEELSAERVERAVAAEAASARQKAGGVLAELAHEITDRERLADGAKMADELARYAYAYFDPDERERLSRAAELLGRQAKAPLYEEKLSDARREAQEFLEANPLCPTEGDRWLGQNPFGLRGPLGPVSSDPSAPPWLKPYREVPPGRREALVPVLELMREVHRGWDKDISYNMRMDWEVMVDHLEMIVKGEASYEWFNGFYDWIEEFRDEFRLFARKHGSNKERAAQRRKVNLVLKKLRSLDARAGPRGMGRTPSGD